MSENKNLDFIIHTDGGCFPNPGGPGGCAFIAICNSEKLYIEDCYHYSETTNNRMELMAFLHALEYLSKNYNIGKIYWYSDSQYALNTVSKWMWSWKKKGWKGKKNVDLCKRIMELITPTMVRTNWVKGHSGDEYNELCDQMCADAVVNIEPIKDYGYEVADKPIKKFKCLGNVGCKTQCKYCKLQEDEN